MNTLPALSIRQPWAWLILHGGKDIENRTWATRFRGRFLLHVALYLAARIRQGITLPPFEELPRGGIVGEAELVNCVSWSDSPWFMGDYGFVLRNIKPLSFTPCRGALGIFSAAGFSRTGGTAVPSPGCGSA
jgi:hypothetical protein